MRNLLLFCLIMMFAVACGPKNPIVFQKKSELSEVTLSLDTNGTFEYSAHSTVGAAFNEKGTYTIEDSLLILRYQYQSYEHLCYEIPLQNDTSLIMNYKGTYMLFPIVKDIPEFEVHYSSNKELMEFFMEEYHRSGFSERVGTRYFALKSGDFSLIFNGKWKISPYYDSLLK